MIHLNIILTVNEPQDIPEVKELLTRLGQLSRAEPGCLRYNVFQSTEDNQVFTINEHWESQEALDVHRTAEGYTQIYKPKVLPMVTRVAHPSIILE